MKKLTKSQIISIIFLVAVAALIGVIAIVQAVQKSQPGKEVAFANACTNDNKDKRVSMDAYISATTNFLTFCDKKKCSISAYGTKEDLDAAASKEKRMSIDVSLGTGNNQMEELKDKFTESDVKLKDDKGNKLTEGDKAKLTGNLKVYDSSDNVNKLGCTLEVDKIEKL